MLRSAAAIVLLAAVSVGLGGCGRGEFEDRTAVVVVGGSRETYEVDDCGLDEQTVYAVARAPSGAILQLVMGLEDDDKTGVPASTGATIDLDPSSTDSRVAAFGAEAWELREATGPAPGSITSARLRGSRIQVSGEAVAVDAQDRPVADAEPSSFSVDARCDLDGD